MSSSRLVQKIGNTLWVHQSGQTSSVDLTPKPARGQVRGGAKSVGTSSDGVLRSPMPGKILKIAFAVGSAVRQGQTVCVLEAMKMEYALKAPFDGKIKTVFKKAADQVQLDEAIAEIEPEGSKK